MPKAEESVISDLQLLEDSWLQTPSEDPAETVRSAIEAQAQKEYTIAVRVEYAQVDEEETARAAKEYSGSDLAKSRGWSEGYLAEHFVAVRARYYAEYDHVKTFLDDGNLEQCFYLTRDLVTGKWAIEENTSPYPASCPEPRPQPVQLPNPIITVETAAEMEQYLDFPVPLLDKEAEAYTVLVTDNIPAMGQVNYVDGSQFRVQYGSGDISGIYGGTLEETGEIDGVAVSYYKYAGTDSAITYALWEQNGFTYSYIYTAGGKGDVGKLIQK